MSDTSLNAAHIANNLADFESARTSFFSLLIDLNDLGNLLKPSFTGEKAAAAETDYYKDITLQDTLRLTVTKCSIPHYTVSKLQYKRGNDTINFAGVPEFNDGNITVDDVVGLDTKSILMSWLRQAYDPYTRKGGRMVDYKKNATLIEYTQDFVEIRRWNIKGMFITSLSEDDFDKENDGKRQITANFVYDIAFMALPDAEDAN